MHPFHLQPSAISAHGGIVKDLFDALSPVTSLSPIASSRADMSGSLIAMSGQGGQRQNGLIVDLALEVYLITLIRDPQEISAMVRVAFEIT